MEAGRRAVLFVVDRRRAGRREQTHSNL